MSDDDNNNVLKFPIIERADIERDELANFFGFGFRCYTLINRTPIPVDKGAIEWAEVMVQRHRVARQSGVDPWRVDETMIGQARVSTVFLGLDHRFGGEGPPILFETMIFGGRLDEFQNRCCTWDEAEAMHAEAVRLVSAGQLRVVK